MSGKFGVREDGEETVEGGWEESRGGRRGRRGKRSESLMFIIQAVQATRREVRTILSINSIALANPFAWNPIVS
jgi:hypothetical protein